jgi:hypothetical protein
LPEDRRETCLGDYSNASWSWDKALKPYQRPAGQAPTKFDVVYGEAKHPFDTFGRAFRATEVMEKYRRVPAGPVCLADTVYCGDSDGGQPDAHWNVPSHKVTLCYEMAEEFVELLSSSSRRTGTN